MRKYLPRLIDNILKEELNAFGAVLVKGPKRCGKTETCRQIAKSVFEFQDPELFSQYCFNVLNNPAAPLSSPKPILFDEGQDIPEIWDTIRLDIDHQKGQTGLYLLTGSTGKRETQTKHSGAGRISRLQMRTMSSYESGDSSGQISLKDLFDGLKTPAGYAGQTIRQIGQLIVRGGWPETVTATPDIAVRKLSGYYRQLIEEDVSAIDAVRRNPERIKAFLRGYSRRISTTATNETILTDLNANDGTISAVTYGDYRNVLKKLFVIEDLAAFSPKLRSRGRIRTSDKKQFADPALACVANGIGVDDLLNDIKTFGLYFESLCVRDLRVYMQTLGGQVCHYRDSDNLEIDIILHLPNGRWAAVEVKLGQENIQKGIDSLLKLKNKVAEENLAKLAFAAVVSNNKYAYTTKEGVHVIPLLCLKP
jgi:predicted AAA+ superfamily ATPase